MFRYAACGIAVVALASVGRADDAAVARGGAVVEEWCRLCHLRTDDPPNPVMAPRFEDIVRREGRDNTYFTRFLKEDHFPMTTYRLFDSEKMDVVAWLVDLQARLNGT